MLIFSNRQWHEQPGQGLPGFDEPCGSVKICYFILINRVVAVCAPAVNRHK